MTDRSCVLDASSVLALARRESGASVVAVNLEDSAVSTVNWSEIVLRSQRNGVPVDSLRETLAEAGVTLVPFNEVDAETAAALWSTTRHLGLSLADRACLALAARLGVPAVTADRAWADLAIGVEILCVR